ncbi:MAG TPA: hypothetical protein VE642_07735 [Pyrinomonadaceae bacterium]|nr:hypothetical protein [Pyrinomonadaceae bacterium]
MDGITLSKLIRDVAIIAALIGVVGTVIGVILGFFLQRIDKGWDEIESARIAKATLLATPPKSWLYPNLYPHLRILRSFLIKHPSYLRHKQNDVFFKKWLTDPVLDTGLETTYWKDERIEEMLRDLSETRIWRVSRLLF